MMREPEGARGFGRGLAGVIGHDAVTCLQCCTLGAMCHPVRMTDSLILRFTWWLGICPDSQWMVSLQDWQLPGAQGPCRAQSVTMSLQKHLTPGLTLGPQESPPGSKRKTECARSPLSPSFFFFNQRLKLYNTEKYRTDYNYCRTIVLQYCVCLCHTSTRISHRYTCDPYLLNIPPTSSYPIPPLQVITEPWVEFPVLHSKFSLAICFTYSNVYVSMLFSQFVPLSPSTTVSTSLFSVSEPRAYYAK